VRRLSTVVGMLIWLGSPTPMWAQDAKQADASTCMECHGGGGEGAPNFGLLGGQDAAYLVKQLREYRSGKRKNDLMAPVVVDMKAQDIRALAAHFAKQTLAPAKVEDAQLAVRGKALYEGGNPATGVPGCVGCHQANGVGSPRYPRLAGQIQTYTVQQMTDFKAGSRSNDRARVMRALAARMTEEEVKAVAEYVAGLSGAK